MMVPLEKKIQRLLNIKNEEEAKTKLKKLESNRTFTGEYYALHAFLAISDHFLPQGWLWCWRGLDKTPGDKQLLYIMDYINNELGREGFPTRFSTSIKNRVEQEKIPIEAAEREKTTILQGTMEIANQMHTISKGTTRLGVINHTLNYYPAYLGYASDYTWPISREMRAPGFNNNLKRFTADIVPFYDLFHFHFGKTLTLNHADLDVIKHQRKGMIMHHWGSEVRLLSTARKTNPYAKVKIEDEKMLKQNLAFLSGKIPHCIVADEEMYQYVKDYYQKVSIVPLMIDLQKYKPPEVSRPVQNRPLKIVHAPTSPEIKGTSHVVNAIDKLKSEYSFEFTLIQKMSHEQARQEYQKADLVIDQLHIGSYGLLAVESMAMGKPVICWISDYMKEKYPSDLPLISANPDSIENTLRNLLQHPEQLEEIGQKSRIYTEEHHDMIKNSQQILHIYEEELSANDLS
ncbi:glycosyltransferase [Sediminibacillus dalangtanensis]|nr:glycosyltransferase [Sediminibacillus dalangtanensis]